eukprot:Hpha_TRINITY_DN14374_c0_g1::TRINITY_DN14374_c0_g1_i1::g.86566::m.86566
MGNCGGGEQTGKGAKQKPPVRRAASPPNAASSPQGFRQVAGSFRTSSRVEWTCPNPWCMQRFPLAEEKKHRAKCDACRPLRCFKCGEQIIERDLRAHSAICEPESCPDCGEVVLKRLLKYCPVKLWSSSMTLLGSQALSYERVLADPEKRRNLAARVIQRAWRSANAILTGPASFGRSRLVQNLISWREQKRKRWVSAVFRVCWHYLDRWDERGLFTPRREGLVQYNRRVEGPRKRISQHFKKTPSGLLTDQKGVEDLLKYPTGGYAALAKGPPQDREDHVQAVREALVHSKLRGAYVAALVDEATAYFKKCPNVQIARLHSSAMSAETSHSAPKAAKCIIVGDLHGQLQDLNRIINDHHMPTPTKYYVFNGDLVDRGPNSCEVLFLVLCLLLAYPASVFINRGNHESLLCTAHYGFREEVIRKYSSALFQKALELFNSMPLATLLSPPSDCKQRSVFVVHGGLPRHVWDIQQLDKLERFREVPEEPQGEGDEVFVDLLWSDPDMDAEQGGLWRFNEQRQAGIFWTQELSQKWVEKNNLLCVVRSHAPPFAGWQRTHDGLVWTIFSASNYTGVDSNDGGVLVVTGGHDEFNIIAHTWRVFQPLDTAELLDPALMDLPQNREPSQEGPGSPVIVGTRSSGLRKALSAWTKSAQDDVLRQLRERIYNNRHVLMAQFCDIDLSERGGVWKSEWVQAMSTLCEGWEGLPWFFLRSYLAEVEGAGAQGRVNFAPFLHRHTVPLEVKLFKRWLPHLLPWLRMRAEVSSPGSEWEDFCPHTLRYPEFFDLVTNTLDCSLQRDVVFLLYGAFDEEEDGRCRREEWSGLYEKHRNGGYIAGEQSWEEGGWQGLEGRRHTLWDMWLLRRIRDHLSRLPTPLVAFSIIDDDKDGKLGLSDMRKLVSSLGVASATQDVHQRHLDSSAADYRKRVRYVLGEGETAQSIANLFGKHVKDIHVDRNECTIQVWPPSDSQLEFFLQQMDCDGDGEVTYKDYNACVTIQDLNPPNL